MIFAAMQNEADHRALVIGIIILVVLFFFIGLIGMAIRAIMSIQTKRIETAMSDVTKTHVVKNTKEFRTLALKKSNRMLYKDSIIPFLIAIAGILAWAISNLITQRWGANIFSDFGELFFSFNWNADGVIISLFGLKLIGAFPPVASSPTFVLEHLGNYIAVALFITSWVYYFVVCQAFLSRLYALMHLGRTVFEKTLSDYKADNDDPTIPNKPLSPNE